MKLCKYCNKYYPESEFGVALSTENKIYRRLKCKFCYNTTKKILRDKQQKWLDDYKKDHKCFKCGLGDYRVLEFHHIGDKEFTIAYAFFNHYGIERIKKEVEKCKVVILGAKYENTNTGSQHPHSGTAPQDGCLLAHR